MKKSLSILVVVALIALATLSLGMRTQTANTGPTPLLPANSLAVPLIAQATSYSCGAAALMSVLYYWNAYGGNESGLYSMLETTPKDGTEPIKIVEVAKAHGLQASMRTNMTVADLRAALGRGETVILALQAWRDTFDKKWSDTWDSGHYAVLVAMDAEFAYFMDPSAVAGYAYVPITELLERWHDYEDRHGVISRYLNLGITITGAKNLVTIPGPLVRMD
ncbi:MAG: C39 family peptidase [Deltaproteobacteria bacterium]|nr:C39 family peptidase [Deltaproteobacteria bacterium]